MNTRNLSNSADRAVSPVIGVILMVAITVILAAVIGTFVLDLGQNVQNTGPTASMGFNDASDTFDNTSGSDFLTIEHQSGQPIEGDELRITVRNVSSNEIVAEYDQGTQESGTWTINGNTLDGSSTVKVGDLILIEGPLADGTGASAGFDYEVNVVSTSTDNKIGGGTVTVN